MSTATNQKNVPELSEGWNQTVGWSEHLAEASNLRKHHREQLISVERREGWICCSGVGTSIQSGWMAARQYEEFIGRRQQQKKEPESDGTSGEFVHPSRVSPFSSTTSNVWKRRVILKYQSRLKQ